MVIAGHKMAEPEALASNNNFAKCEYKEVNAHYNNACLLRGCLR